MDEERFLYITDILSNLGYSFFKEEIHYGRSGYIVEAIRDNQQQYYLIIPPKEFSFEALSIIKEVSGPSLYALERYFVSYTNIGQKAIEIDQTIFKSMQNTPEFFPSSNSSRRVLWSTDIHLNFLENTEVKKFIAQVKEQNPDVYLISGDIGESQNFAQYLLQIEQALDCPIYFVLGNHDFYCGSIDQVRSIALDVSKKSNKLCWLNQAGVIELSQEVALIGHDGWGDGRLGAGIDSELMLSDYFVIQDFSGLEKKDLFQKLHHQGDIAAAHLKQTLLQAFGNYSHVVLLTHVPPFAEAAFHLGRLSDANALPHFTCKAVGEVLLEVMKIFPHCNLLVLCGHTHSAGVAHILPNLTVLTGSARYLKPEIQKVFML